MTVQIQKQPKGPNVVPTVMRHQPSAVLARAVGWNLRCNGRRPAGAFDRLASELSALAGNTPTDRADPRH
jgi:hypothetical protein